MRQAAGLCLPEENPPGSNEQADRMRRNTLAASREAEALLGRRLDVHAVHAHIAGRGNVAPHLLDVRAQLRPLCDDRRVKIADRKAPPAHRRDNRRKQLEAVGPLILRVLFRTERGASS